MNLYRQLALFGATLLFATVAVAHHSFAIFDFETKIPFEGVVETLNFRNPHISMTLKVTNEDGTQEIINFIEGAPANMLVRSGFRPDMIKPGTHIKTVGSPKIDAPDEYFLRSIFLDDGTKVEF